MYKEGCVCKRANEPRMWKGFAKQRLNKKAVRNGEGEG